MVEKKKLKNLIACPYAMGQSKTYSTMLVKRSCRELNNDQIIQTIKFCCIILKQFQMKYGFDSPSQNKFDI